MGFTLLPPTPSNVVDMKLKTSISGADACNSGRRFHVLHVMQRLSTARSVVNIFPQNLKPKTARLKLRYQVEANPAARGSGGRLQRRNRHRRRGRRGGIARTGRKAAITPPMSRGDLRTRPHRPLRAHQRVERKRWATAGRPSGGRHIRGRSHGQGHPGRTSIALAPDTHADKPLVSTVHTIASAISVSVAPAVRAPLICTDASGL